MGKKIAIGALMLLSVASVCFGILFATLYFSNNDEKEEFVSTYQNDVVGVWKAIKCDPIGNGSAFDTAGKIFEFTVDRKMKYYENEVEVVDKRSTYSWKSQSEMLLTADSNFSERSFIISFDNSGNMIAEDLSLKVKWTLEKNDKNNNSLSFDSTNKLKIIGLWNATNCISKNGGTIDYAGKAFVFTDKNLTYYENGTEVKDKTSSYIWESEDTIRLTATSGETRLWKITFDNSGNLVIDDDVFNVIWTLSKNSQTQTQSTNNAIKMNYSNSINQNRIVGAWKAVECSKINGDTFNCEDRVFKFTKTNLYYYENGVEILSKRCTYRWLSDVSFYLTSTLGENREWTIAFNNDNKVTVIDTTYEVIWTLERVVDDGGTPTTEEPYISPYHSKILGIWMAIDCDRDGITIPFEGKVFTFNSDMTLKYYEDGVEISDKASTFRWLDITTMLLISESGEEREWLLSTDNEGNLIIKDDWYGVIWTLKRGIIGDNNTPSTEEPYISPYHSKILGIWMAIDCDRDGITIPFEGKVFTFNSDMTLKYYEDGVEISDKASTFRWLDITTMLLISESGEEREWLLSTDNEGNLIIKDDWYGVIWTLKRGV